MLHPLHFIMLPFVSSLGLQESIGSVFMCQLMKMKSAYQFLPNGSRHISIWKRIGKIDWYWLCTAFFNVLGSISVHHTILLSQDAIRSHNIFNLVEASSSRQTS